MKKLKLGLIIDIDYRANSNCNRVNTLALLEAFVSEMNQKQASLVIDLGDGKSKLDKQTDMKLEREVAAIFKQLSMPYIRFFCNDDINAFNEEDHAKFIGTSVAPQSLDINGYHLVFWQPDTKAPEGFIATEEKLAWLTKNLKETLDPSLVFTCAPFSEALMLDNYYFPSTPKKHYAKHKNADAIRSIVEASNVIACIAGHGHCDSLKSIRGVHYITLRSLIENSTKTGETSGSWAWLELSDSLTIKVRGKDSFDLRLPIRVNKQINLEAIAWSLTP